MATTKKTTKKTTSTAATKKVAVNAAEEPQSTMSEVNKADDTLQKQLEKRKYVSGDYIPCRSVRSGHMQHLAKKSGMIYEWSDFGDVCEVEYGDLLALKASKSKFMYEPWFIIEDDQLAEDWKLSEIYSYFEGSDDAEDFLLKGAVEVRRKLMTAPQGYKDLIVDTAGRMIRSGMLDSIATIQAIDDVMHTQLNMLIGGRP